MLLTCCGSRRWAAWMAEQRPYRDVGALLAQADRASGTLADGDLAEAFAQERPFALAQDPPPSTYAAYTALSAAHAEYERRFGHVFVICLDAVDPSEHTCHVLAVIRDRLASDERREQATAMTELRALTRSRLTRMAEQNPAVPTDRTTS